MYHRRKSTKGFKRVTDSVVLKTVGLIKDPPPKPFNNWKDYLTKSKEPPKPYRSWLEFRIFLGPLKNVDYEPYKIPYTVVEKKNYSPDGVLGDYLFEVKGRFRTREEMNKYIHVRNSISEDMELIFILQSRNTSLPGAAKRKDGTRRCIEDWLQENEFRYTYESELVYFMRELKKEIKGKK